MGFLKNSYFFNNKAEKKREIKRKLFSKNFENKNKDLLRELLKIRNKILIIGPHPDDVEFSTGRLILKRKGKNVFVFCMSDGRKGQEIGNYSESEFAKIRIKESQKALKLMNLNLKNVHYFMLPDQEVMNNPFIIDKMFIVIKNIKPDYVLIPPWEGAHPDHDATHLFSVISLKNLMFDFNKIVEYGSYNYYQGRMNVQKFIPKNSVEFKLYPDKELQKKWSSIMKLFKSQVSLQKKYVPKSFFECYRLLPKYDYSKLPYENSYILRDLLNPIYPLAKKIFPKKTLMFYETWNNINPMNVKKKLFFNKKHYTNLVKSFDNK
ncbi:MAG: PIG-L family deacetylase [Candidatus Woesearchaeota archaeon]